MAVSSAFFETNDRRPGNSDHVWCELYGSLRPYILSWVYSSGVSSWHGQENDIADDILQEAVIRTLKYSRQAEAGKGNPIHSIACFGRTVAHNHFRDLRRRELRLVRPPAQDNGEVPFFELLGEVVDPAEMALAQITRRALLKVLARIIAVFPEKQRIALLIDLANNAESNDEQCPLYAAFYELGIDLRTYRRALPPDPLERSRHAASLSMAYKRLRQQFSLKQCDLAF